MKEILEHPPKLVFEVEFRIYNPQGLSQRQTALRNRIAKVSFNVNSLLLSDLQKKRLLYIVGSRFDGKDTVKIVSRKFIECTDNLRNCLEIIEQLYLEAKRAPLVLPGMEHTLDAYYKERDHMIERFPKLLDFMDKMPLPKTIKKLSELP